MITVVEVTIDGPPPTEVARALGELSARWADGSIELRIRQDPAAASPGLRFDVVELGNLSHRHIAELLEILSKHRVADSHPVVVTYESKRFCLPDDAAECIDWFRDDCR